MIYLCGDTHGINEIGKITNKAFTSGLSADDFVIVLGDFGLFWSERINELLARKNIERYFPATLLFIDGNHENFDMLDELPRERKFGGSVGVSGENIFWLRRGEIYEIAGRHFLCFGGALSVDKAHRILVGARDSERGGVCLRDAKYARFHRRGQADRCGAEPHGAVVCDEIFKRIPLVRQKCSR